MVVRITCGFAACHIKQRKGWGLCVLLRPAIIRCPILRCVNEDFPRILSILKRFQVLDKMPGLEILIMLSNENVYSFNKTPTFSVVL